MRARAWLAANLAPIDASAAHTPRGAHGNTRAAINDARALQRRVDDAGFAGITWPVEYGGRGLTEAHEVAFAEESAQYAMPDLGVAGRATMATCAPTMLEHASPEFLRRHIPRILQGDEIWCQFFSEPGAGSDLAGVTTRAVRDGDRWILSGAKIWSSGAFYADYGMCLARTNWDVPKHRGLTWFAVPTDAPGVTVRPLREINGTEEFCEEFFDAVELSDDDVIGTVDHGWTVTQTMLVHERLASEASTGDDDTTPLAPELVALARRVGREQDPLVRQIIAKSHTLDWVQTQLNVRVMEHLRLGTANAAAIAAYSKLAAGTFDPQRARMMLEVGGAAAITWDGAASEDAQAALTYLNCRVMSIAGGTNEMQRNGIGERVLGLPREPSFDTDRPFSEVVRNAAHWTGRPVSHDERKTKDG